MFRRAGVSGLVVGAVASLVLCATSAAMGQEQPPPGRPPMGGPPMMRPAEMPSITVVGSGTATSRPDTAEVTAGVVTQAATAAQALAQNNAGMEKVITAVTAIGIAEKDIQTTNVSVAPQRRQGRQEPQPPDIVGYEVSNQVRIKVRDLTVVGRLLDALVGQGANVLGGISFSVGDPAPVLDQARAKAMADARRKAEVYAKAAGVTVGPLLSIREGQASVPRFGVEMPRMMAASPVPVAPGEQDFQASITVTYALRGGTP
jgi:uncharacterized protein YggE